MRYLLDTNALSHLMRHPAGAVAERARRTPADDLCTSALVACELRYGAAKRGSPTLVAAVDRLLGSLPVLSFDDRASQPYAQLRATLEAQGQGIGGMDLLIAAQALALDTVLVSANVREFARVPGLRLENWAEV